MILRVRQRKIIATIRRQWRKELTTLVTTRAAAAVAASSTASYGSLGLNIALGGACSGLVDGLNGDVGLGFTLLIVACMTQTNMRLAICPVQ